MNKDTFNSKLLAITNTIIQQSYFEADNDKDSSELILLYLTRENGNVGDEEASQKDIDEAYRILKLIKPSLKELNLIGEIEVVNEWVHINIFPPQGIETRYAFIKHTKENYKDINNRGFSEGFKTLEELNNRYGSWVGQDVSNFDFGDVTPTVIDYGGLNKVVKVLDAKDVKNTFGYHFSLGIGFKAKTLTFNEHYKTLK